MKKILIAEIAQEVSTFNPVQTNYDAFQVHHNENLFNYHNRKPTQMGGAIKVLKNYFHIVPTIGARATSGGPMSEDCWKKISTEYLQSIKIHKENIDGIYLSLHGAMQGVSENDPEGWILKKTREIFGKSIPIVFSMDLHGILTKKMITYGDAFTSFHTYPHIDFFDTGKRAAELLRYIISGAKLSISRIRIPALVRGNELITETGCFGDQINKIKKLEETKQIISGGFHIGNPFTDVPELCSQIYFIYDKYHKKNNEEIKTIAEEFWNNRASMQSNLIDIDEAYKNSKITEGTIIYTDAADAPSSGATGDSNYIIKFLHQKKYNKKVLAPITDPALVQKAINFGIDNEFIGQLGGYFDNRFKPYEMKFKVKFISDGDHIEESRNVKRNSGKTAVLISENFTIVCTSKPISLFDRSIFLGAGIDPKKYDLIVVKSPHCRPEFFDEWSQINLNIDAPGSTSANLHSLGHKICERPIYPLEENTKFDLLVEEKTI